MRLMTAYRLSPSLPLSQWSVNLNVILAHLPFAIQDNNVLTAYHVEASIDDDIEIEIGLGRGSFLPLSIWLKYAIEGLLDRGRLLGGRWRSESDVVAMAHDASRGIDGDVLVNWLLPHYLDYCGPRGGPGCVGSCRQKSVEESSSLGGGKGGWWGAGGGGWYCHVERIGYK